MPFFRLLNLDTLVTEVHDLDHHPRYIAASHAWIDNSFDTRKGAFYDCFGGKGVKAVVDQAYLDIHHCWVDRFCINQRDKRDKLEQIPLMERIFGQADAVVVLLNTLIGADQIEVDKLVDQLQDAVTMSEENTWEEHGHYWQYGNGRHHVIHAMNGLQRLASTVWATRVWTMQEFVLAKSIFWVGLDLKPIKVEDAILSAVPDICDTLSIEECLHPQNRVVFSYLQGMANVRLGNVDRTRVMELLGNRNTRKAVDEVYGSMSASGVIIKPLADESKFSAWRRWWETAVVRGHLRWIMLPTNGKQPEEGEETNCITPQFTNRHLLSASSGLDQVIPMGSVAVSNGCVTVSARRLGKIEILERLGGVRVDRSGRLVRDITLILFGQGKRRLSSHIVAAFGGGRYNSEQAEAIVEVLMQNYLIASVYVLSGNEVDFRPSLDGKLQQEVWTDFMKLQQINMSGLNEGTGYLCQIVQELTADPLVTVLVSGDFLPSTDLEALDFEAKDPSGRSVFMAVSSFEDGGGSAHKVGMTLPVSDDFDDLWARLPLKTIRIGGKECRFCNTYGNKHNVEASAMREIKSSASKSRVHVYAMRALRKQLAILTRQHRKGGRFPRLVCRKTFIRAVSTRRRT